ncbi:MAG: hypothetical protein A3G87_09755 [Omnitrophica bacterium RIFCSPLOWO2_12_FULL_50_11]|nr:MAG: hypothetical protein A3G87_09755 [Omnitrophica bacterium RIFCSPLOWO2_12_FULL_50_11]
MRTIPIVLLVLLFLAQPAWSSADSRIPSEWYDRARSDLEVAELVFERKVHPPTVCFHAHQAVEKLLKGLVIEHGRTPDQIHETARFVHDLTLVQPQMEILLPAAGALDRFYISSRYPKQGGPQIGRAEAEQCLTLAKPFFYLVEGKVSARM